MEATARRWRERGRSTKLFEIMRKHGRDVVSSGVIADALARHDHVTERLLEQAVWGLGIALSNTQNLLGLEAIIVGGRLRDRLGEPVRARVPPAATPHPHVPGR